MNYVKKLSHLLLRYSNTFCLEGLIYFVIILNEGKRNTNSRLPKQETEYVQFYQS